jgi:hypothetical protein
MRERTYLEARRAAAQDSTQPTDKLAVGSALFGGIAVTLLLVLHAIALPAPPMPDLSQVLYPQTGPPHVESGHVPSNDTQP